MPNSRAAAVAFFFVMLVVWPIQDAYEFWFPKRR